jgi:hypothetical protein
MCATILNAIFTFCLIYISPYYKMFRPYTAIIGYVCSAKLFHCILYFVTSLYSMLTFDVNFLNHLLIETIKSSLKIH